MDLTPEELARLLDEAAERGARRALAGIGLDNGEAREDVASSARCCRPSGSPGIPPGRPR